MAQLVLNLVTPQKDVLHSKVDQVTAPSIMGEVGLLPDHLPLLAKLQEGPVGLFSGGVAHYYAVSGGLVEIHRNVVTILADSAERADEIDVRRSEKALADAEAKLKGLEPSDPAWDEQEARARRARTRIQVAGLK